MWIGINSAGDAINRIYSGRCQHFFGGTSDFQSAVVNHTEPVAAAGREVEVMKDDSDTVALVGKLAEELEDFQLKTDVQGRSGFVEKHDLGLLCQ